MRMLVDSKWSWLVLGAGFICRLNVDGISHMFGYLKDEIREHFDLPDTDIAISTIGTITQSTTCLIGPLAAQLIDVTGTKHEQ